MTYIKKNTAEIKSNIILNLVQNVDTINDANIGSALDLFTTAMSQELSEQYDDMDIVYNATRITTATGDDLEEIGLIVGVTRDTGTQATGTVSFIRNSAATSNVTIASGTVVATQPNTTEEQYQFTTTETKILYTAIADEAQAFVDGLYYYKLNSRFIDSITSLDGTLSSAAHNFLLDIDYELISDYDGTIIDHDNVTLIEDCETAGDWTPSGTNTITANTVTYLEGTQSLNIVKSDTSTAYTYGRAVFATTFDLTTNSLIANMYIKDATELAKIVQVSLSASDAVGWTEHFTKPVLNANLAVGWNKIIIDRTDSEVITTGNPDYTELKYLQIQVTTNNVGDTFTAGELMFDFIYTSTYESYFGDVIHFIQTGDNPDDGTSIAVDYVPLSVDVACTGEDVGEIYNVSKGQINYKVTALSSINRVYNYNAYTGGVDIETDTDYRDRIKTAGDLIDVSTINAIQSNVLNLTYVKTCEVNDLPLKNIEEAYVYNSSTKLISLVNKVAIDNASLVISDTLGGSADYTKTTDYLLTDENEIDFDQSGAEPTNGNTIYVTYDYNKLGYFEVFVTGLLGELNTFELEEVEEVVIAKKAAGVNYEIKQPTYINVVVAATLTIDSTAVTATVQTNVETAIQNYINLLDIGDDVLLAGVINSIMEVSGVDNVSVTDIGSGGAADYVINSDEKAIASTITLS